MAMLSTSDRQDADPFQASAARPRRRLLITVAAIGAALALAACKPSDAQKPAASTPSSGAATSTGTSTSARGPGTTSQASTIFTGIVAGVAVGGYDPVAYFTEKKPVVGKAEFTLSHEGAVWRFASAANRDAFQAAPAKFAPQYGGHCAWAIGQGYTAKGDPNVWSITDGKLYLNFNQSVQRSWSQDVPGNIAKANANWPRVVAAK